MSYQVLLYETLDGRHPVEDFLNSLDDKMRAKLIGLLELLEEKGPVLREPYSKHLSDGIFELRCKFGSDITRALYFFCKGNQIIVTNGFIKKTQRTPPKEIRLAKNRRNEFLHRPAKKEEDTP